MIRLAKLHDLPAIVAIYNEAVAAHCSGDLTAVSVESRLAWFNEHDPARHPVFVYVEDDKLSGWCSLNSYREGRLAFRHTAEISYYVTANQRRKGIASALVHHAIGTASALNFKTLFAVVLETNLPSRKLLERVGFSRWGFLPDIADFEGCECGHFYYGRKLTAPAPAVDDRDASDAAAASP